MSQNITIVGNLAADPELKFTANGKAVANFTVMTSRRVKDDQGNWSDEDVTGWPVSVWDQTAEHVCESLRKGDRVIVVGAAAIRTWETKDGGKGSRMEVKGYEVAASMKRWPVIPARAQAGAPSSKPITDPWGTPPTDDIPPF